MSRMNQELGFEQFHSDCQALGDGTKMHFDIGSKILYVGGEKAESEPNVTIELSDPNV